MKIGGRLFRMPKFRVRTLLIVVALAAVAIEGTRAMCLWYGYFKEFRLSAGQERGCRAGALEAEVMAAEVEEQLKSDPFSPSLKDELGQIRESAEQMRTLPNWRGRRARKYQQAMRLPWREVPTDSILDFPPFIAESLLHEPRRRPDQRPTPDVPR